MHVLVATDGEIEAATAADFASRLAGADGRVTVLTVVEVPRTFLNDIRDHWGPGDGASVVADYTFVETPVARQDGPSGWPGDAAMIDRYLRDKLRKNTGPLVDALAQRGIDVDPRVVESENVTAAIMKQVVELDADVVVIGSHGQGLFQGLLGSTGTKIVRRSPRPVLLIRSATT
ncbi:MAG: universal stress protein [Acidimicrobiia bacterium]